MFTLLAFSSSSSLRKGSPPIVSNPIVIWLFNRKWEKGCRRGQNHCWTGGPANEHRLRSVLLGPSDNAECIYYIWCPFVRETAQHQTSAFHSRHHREHRAAQFSCFCSVLIQNMANSEAQENQPQPPPGLPFFLHLVEYIWDSASREWRYTSTITAFLV